MYYLVSKELRDLAEQLQKARIDDDYVETDLRMWQAKLQKLRDDVSTQVPSVTVREDRTQTVVGYIHVSTSAIRVPSQTERFGKFFGDVRIDDHGCLATHIGSRNNTAFVRGISEYSTGKHKIRFLFKKQKSCYITYFSIVPKRPPTHDELTEIGYGWTSADSTVQSSIELSNDKNFQDMEGQTTFEIELQLDCDNRKISYVNQRTKNRREMDVDIAECPFPWQIRFNLYEVGDSVKLLT